MPSSASLAKKGSAATSAANSAFDSGSDSSAMVRVRRIQSCANAAPLKIYQQVKQFVMTFTTEHDSKFYYIWLWVISTAVLYNVIVVPLRASFVEANLYHLKAWLTLDYVFADVVYLVDVFVRARMAFYQQGILVTDVSVLAKRYVRSWQFVVDVVSIFPTDIIYAGVGVTYTIVRVNRLLRVGRVFEMTTRVESNASFPNVFRMATTVFGVLLALHYIGIFYHSYSKAIGLGESDKEMNDFQLSRTRAEKQPFTVYTYCFYWATMTLCFIGEMPAPNIAHQNVIQIIIWLAGLMMFGAIVGRIGIILNNVAASSNTFQRQVDTVRIYLNLQKVSSDIYEKVILWFGYAFENRVLGGEEKVLKPLPNKMKAELASDMHLAALRRVQLFADLDVNVLVDLVTAFRLQVFSPGDYVCKKGDIGREMYVVKRGKLEVVSDDGQKIFVTLGAGSVFGEISLLNIPGSKTGNRRTANVRSKGYSDLFSLSKDDLYSCLLDYPEAMKKLVEKGTDILRKENKLDEESIAVKTKAEEIIKNRMKAIEDAIEDAETRFARLIADVGASKKAATRRVEMLEQTLNLPPLNDELLVVLNERGGILPTSMSQTPIAAGLLVRGLGAIPSVKLMPASPVHSLGVPSPKPPEK